MDDRIEIFLAGVDRGAPVWRVRDKMGYWPRLYTTPWRAMKDVGDEIGCDDLYWERSADCYYLRSAKGTSHSQESPIKFSALCMRCTMWLDQPESFEAAESHAVKHRNQDEHHAVYVVGICPNCGQARHNWGDCMNTCAGKGLAPKPNLQTQGL